MEGFQNNEEAVKEEKPKVHPAERNGENVVPSVGNVRDEIFQKVSEGSEVPTAESASVPRDCFPKDQLSAEELLPTDKTSKWAMVNPAGQGELGDQNFLTSGFHVGVNTVGQSLRNANRQVRSEPPNPMVQVSPWLQTTIEPDTGRRPLEVGGN